MAATVDRMSELRRDTWRTLRAAMSDADVTAAERCASRLGATLRKPLGETVVLVAYGGGKDSSYTLALVRAIQLILFERHSVTFTLRSATSRHAGMPSAVLDNIDRAYQALRLTDDSGCEALLIDGSEIRAFHPLEPLPPAVVARNRLDLLMTGHRTFGEGRPTFCNACNLSMVNAFGLAAAYGRPADVIITGDSAAEQRSYQRWIARLARRVAAGTPPAVQRPDVAGGGFTRFLRRTDTIARTYFTDLYGPDAEPQIAERRVSHDVPDDLVFFSIFEDAGYASARHWQLLTEFLGFRFDDIAFSFTESDCGNPTLMAHFRGLKCERIYRRAYADGLTEYTEFAESLMRSKEIPEVLIDIMRQRYGGEGAADRMRAIANDFARQSYGLDEEQLVCMVYSPLTDSGERLGEYLRREQRDLAPREAVIRAVLEGSGPDDEEQLHAATRLEEVTGLALRWQRELYRSPAVRFPVDGKPGDLLAAILAGDPHKTVVDTRHAPGGPTVRELITGR